MSDYRDVRTYGVDYDGRLHRITRFGSLHESKDMACGQRLPIVELVTVECIGMDPVAAVRSHGVRCWGCFP